MNKTGEKNKRCCRFASLLYLDTFGDKIWDLCLENCAYGPRFCKDQENWKLYSLTLAYRVVLRVRISLAAFSWREAPWGVSRERCPWSLTHIDLGPLRSQPGHGAVGAVAEYSSLEIALDSGLGTPYKVPTGRRSRSWVKWKEIKAAKTIEPESQIKKGRDSVSFLKTVLFPLYLFSLHVKFFSLL